MSLSHLSDTPGVLHIVELSDNYARICKLHRRADVRFIAARVPGQLGDCDDGPPVLLHPQFHAWHSSMLIRWLPIP